MKYLLLLVFVLFSCSSMKRSPSSQSRILFIGDSQTAGNLGKYTYQHLSNQFSDSEIELYGIGSSSPRHWASTTAAKEGQWLCSQNGRINGKTDIPVRERLCQGPENQSIYAYLNRKKSDYVIFQFLGNSMGFSKEHITEKINLLLAELGNQECLFITSPPFFYELEEKNQLRKTTEDYFIQAIGNRCKVFAGMSRENFEVFAKDKKNYLKDRIHLSEQGAENFFKQFKDLLP
ncbi:MAG: hypothetical protein Fur0010_23080 [Bdellovibrio sp.]